MIKVNKNFDDVPEILKNSNRKEAFEKNIDDEDFNYGKTLYKADVVQERLKTIYNFKCAYCEKDIRDEDKHIEHYRPKNIYYWLAYSWDNLLLSCGQCNRHKWNNFETKKTKVTYTDEEFEDIHNLGKNYDELEEPMIINPEKDDILEDIQFDKNAFIDSENERVKHTIFEACDLNRNMLIENRVKIFNQLNRSIRTNLGKKSKSGIESAIENFIEDCKVENEYYAFRYFIINNIEIFFPKIPLQKIIKGFL